MKQGRVQSLKCLLMLYLQRTQAFVSALLQLFKQLLLRSHGCNPNDTRFVRDSNYRDREDLKLKLLSALLGVEIEVTFYQATNNTVKLAWQNYIGEAADFPVLKDLTRTPSAAKFLVSLFQIRGTYCCAYRKEYTSQLADIIRYDEEMRYCYELVGMAK